MQQSFKYFYTLIFLVLFTSVACTKEIDAHKEMTTGHPRILLLKGEEQQIKELIETEDTWKNLHFAILDECSKIRSKPPVKRELIGRRLLSKSREFLRRVFYLSYAHRMTGEEIYLNRAEYEMLAVAEFSDWNPSHFLDVSEMTMGMAIGYDWLFNELSEDSKKTIREAIVNKGINPSYDDQYNWFLRAEHNWNQVCNAGMTYGALAVQDDYPELAKRTIDRAFESIPLAMEAYKPDGGYPEGYGYWGYGTSFNVMFLSAMEKTPAGVRGLNDNKSFLQTGTFLLHMLAPSGDSFNWSDNGLRGHFNPSMFWFAKMNEKPSILWSEKQFLNPGNHARLTKDRLLPAIMIWGKNIPLSEIDPPSSTFWVGQGPNPMSMMRTSWTDPDAIYVGFKAGSPSVNHGHMDIGSFVMEADGERWASDLGVQSYESLESKGIKVFGRTQDAQRWTIFRMNNFAHNTLTVNDELQRVDGYGKVEKHSDSKDFMFAVSDISSVYNGQLKKAVRGVGIKKGSWVVVRDEFKTLDKPVKIRWNMVTYADIVLGDKEATLTLEGKKLLLKVSGPDNIQMKTWSTAPTNDYDAENPGTIMVGFEVDLPANITESFEVLLIPEEASEEAVFTRIDMKSW